MNEFGINTSKRKVESPLEKGLDVVLFNILTLLQGTSQPEPLLNPDPSESCRVAKAVHETTSQSSRKKNTLSAYDPAEAIGEYSRPELT